MLLYILTLIDKIIKQIRHLIQFFGTKQETSIDEIESNVLKVMLEIGRITQKYGKDITQSQSEEGAQYVTSLS